MIDEETIDILGSEDIAPYERISLLRQLANDAVPGEEDVDRLFALILLFEAYVDGGLHGEAHRVLDELTPYIPASPGIMWDVIWNIAENLNDPDLAERYANLVAQSSAQIPGLATLCVAAVSNGMQRLELMMLRSADDSELLGVIEELNPFQPWRWYTPELLAAIRRLHANGSLTQSHAGILRPLWRSLAYDVRFEIGEAVAEDLKEVEGLMRHYGIQ